MCRLTSVKQRGSLVFMCRLTITVSNRGVMYCLDWPLQHQTGCHPWSCAGWPLDTTIRGCHLCSCSGWPLQHQTEGVMSMCRLTTAASEHVIYFPIFSCGGWPVQCQTKRGELTSLCVLSAWTSAHNVCGHWQLQRPTNSGTHLLHCVFMWRLTIAQRSTQYRGRIAKQV